MSLLNVDYKIGLKALVERLKKPSSVYEYKQRAYVKERFICNTDRYQISDIIDVLNIDGFLVAMDIEKAFDLLNHSVLLVVYKKFGCSASFINWIEATFNKSEFCVIKSGKTTQYFQLNRGAHQGEPISAYLFILVKVLFTLINNELIQGLDILSFRFPYSAYADDSTFFLRNIDLVKGIKTIFIFFQFKS